MADDGLYNILQGFAGRPAPASNAAPDAAPPAGSLRSSAMGILDRIANGIGPNNTSRLGIQGPIVARAGDWVGIGGAGLAALGAATLQPELVAAGMTGMGLGSLLSNLGKAGLVASDALSKDGAAAVRDSVGAGLGNVLPPGVDPQPAVNNAGKYFGL